MRAKEFLGEARLEGEWVYHASYLPDQTKGFASVLKKGLIPSKTGYSGPGVYFARSPNDTYYHVSPEEATMFRTKWKDLVSLYGTYPENPRGIQRNDDEIIVPGTVPAKYLEVEYFPGEWWDIESAYSDSASQGTAESITSNRNTTSDQLHEGLAHPVIVVDVQPEYSGMNDGDESAVFPQIINFVNKQTGPVLMFVNAEDQGTTGDTIAGIKEYWEDTVRELNDDYENPQPINWTRFQVVDKGYGYMRSWMDHGIEPSTIIATIRELYQQKKSDTRQLNFPPFNQRTPTQSLIQGAIEEMEDDPLIVNWTSVAQLKRFNGAYLVGGGRNECLREVELLMNAFNIKYKRIDSLVY